MSLHQMCIRDRHPVAVGQLLKLLHDVEVLHEVDTRLLGQVHHGLDVYKRQTYTIQYKVIGKGKFEYVENSLQKAAV